jgi:hypothetical protein
MIVLIDTSTKYQIDLSLNPLTINIEKYFEYL